MRTVKWQGKEFKVKPCEWCEGERPLCNAVRPIKKTVPGIQGGGQVSLLQLNGLCAICLEGLAQGIAAAASELRRAKAGGTFTEEKLEQDGGG